MSTDGQRTKWHRNIAESLNCPSRVHNRYRLTGSDGRQTANVNNALAYDQTLQTSCSLFWISDSTNL